MNLGRKIKNSETDSFKPKSDKHYGDHSKGDQDKTRYQQQTHQQSCEKMEIDI